MMTREEGWITYALEAVEHVLQQVTVWKQFREVIRIMKLISHEHVLQHFQKLSSIIATLELLMDLMLKADLSENQDILGTCTTGNKNMKHFYTNNLFNQKFHKFTFLVKYSTLFNKSVHCSYWLCLTKVFSNHCPHASTSTFGQRKWAWLVVWFPQVSIYSSALRDT